jgi:uncharacterized repeat protein (TIGR01451 family)
MTSLAADSKLFEEVIRELLGEGLSVRFQARGASMSPAIRDGEVVEVTPVIVAKLRKDDIVLAKANSGFRLHRIVAANPANDVFITRGDCGQENDPPLTGAQILGLAQAKEVRVGRNIVSARFRGLKGRMLRGAARAQVLASKLRSSASGMKSSAAGIGLRIFFLLLVFVATVAAAQVAVDTTTSSKATYNTTGNHTLTFAHTTANTANRIIIVGVSMNISAVPGAVVTGITYNGTALISIGSHNDVGNTRRVEMWYLLAPTNGNHNVLVTVNVPTAGTVALAAGATTFTGVDQTVPLGSLASADGAAGANSQLDVPSVVNGMILDTLATGGNQTVTVSGPQVSQWNQNTGGGGTDVSGTGSSRTGAPSVPISETFNGTSNWSLGAVSINPSTADIAVTTSVSAVSLGKNSTYNITITNNGPSAANAVKLTDTFADTNLSLVSVTPSSGTTCTTTTTINCTLPTPFASGATATVAVVVSTTAAGFFPNTATITDSGTPPDPNTGNNTYVALAPVVSILCGTNSLSAATTPLSGVLNTYFPGTASVVAGANSIPVGASTGAGGTIQAGSELLVIQMQDASISTSNTVAYGNNSTGTGFTAINNAGNYEYVTATGPVSGGSVPISGAGGGGGLVFGYTAAAPTATKGGSTYQVVLVPQYTTATLGSATAAAWNGSTGGILALDIAGQLNLGGANVSLDGLGFRGGAGMQLTGATGNNTDYWHVSPTTYTGATGGIAGVDGSKGEGVAGTPEWVEFNQNFLRTTTTEGYPDGTNTTDASMARGAPGNAGGGGTDADPAANDENAGGGGGSNGGNGGNGGDSWNTNLSTGGEGGSPFPATIDRIAMGGGGGAGSRNNSDGDGQASSGAAGGGIIFIRADNFTGTATLTANGANAYNGTLNDAGGGAGAGGTIVVLAANGGESGLTLQANGGTGGNAWEIEAYALTQRHGPGGGGGGGVVFVSGTPASISVAGGANGLTLNTPAVAYGSTPGAVGTSTTVATLSQVTGIQSASLCAPDMTLGKSHVGNFTRGLSASYTIPVSNVSPYGASSGVVVMNDTLPLGITPTGAAGTGWACSVSGQTVSCTRSDALTALGTYPSITLSAIVSQSAPATLTNIATVAGGSEANLLNDTATDIANVVSTADLSVADSASPNPVAAGSNITYTQVVTNSGPSAADNATLVATVPANTTFVSMAAPAGWSCVSPGSGGTGNVVCTDVNMAGSTAATFTMIVKVSSSATNGTVITGVVSASSSTFDPNSANNTASASTVVGTTSQAQMTVTNSASPNPVVAGSDITYTQTATNTGSGTATNPTLTETTPPNTTFQSISAPPGTTCTTPAVGAPGTITCTAASAPAGSSGTVTLMLQVNAGTASGTIITDIVTANSTNQAFGASSAAAQDVVASATQADLALKTVATPLTVFAGNNITYTQTVTNNGPATASTVVFTEGTPTNTTFESVSAPAGWTCTAPAVGATGTVTCNDSSLAANASADIVVVVSVPSPVAAGTISATSNVTATTSDPTTANNTTTVSTPVIVVCDLAVTNSGIPSPVAAGGTITYTQVVTNSGPSNCSTATLNEATPANTTFVSVAVVTTGGGTWTCPNSQPVACTNPSVPPGSTGTITAKYTVAAGTAAGTIITDTATAATTSRDSNAANNSATSSIAVASATQADLSVTNSGSPNPVTAGNNITYTQSVTNAGPAVANAPQFTETLPANTTAVSLNGPAGWTCVLASLTCTDSATMAANSTADFTFVVTVNTTVASGSMITQTDSVSSTTIDPNGANNSASVNVQVAGSADLAITNAASPVPVQAGNNITYTQIVTNNGPSTATTASLTETTPANTTFQSISAASGWSCTTPAVNGTGTINCTNASFASGSGTFTVVLKVNAGTVAGTAITDTASVTSSVSDPNSSNNTATAADVVATATQADLIVTNSASPTSLAAGSNATFTQSVTNNGPASATTVSFTQTTPPNTNFQSISAPAGWSCTTPAVGGTGAITCTIATLAAGSANTASFSLVLQVNAGTPSGTNITETDTATASNIVPSITSNTASALVLVANANSADLAIVKTATPNPVTEGTPLLYSLAVTNNGPASATNVTVTDTLPSPLTYLSSTATQGSCSEAGGVVTCLLGTMANAGTATISILTLPGAPGMISNTANVAADQTDPNLTNNTSTWNETVVAPTSVKLQSFSAHLSTDKSGASRVLLMWKTGGESHNLGFNVYRERNGNRVRMNPSLIAGSALLMTGALPKHSGRSYAWPDPSAEVADASYWLEDVDVNGTRTMHGPVSVETSTAVDDATAAETRMLSQFSQVQSASPAEQGSHFVENVPAVSTPTSNQMQRQFELASHPAVKIQVRHEGWYRVSQPDLVKAGLDPGVDPSLLHLYAEANEQPMQIVGALPGPGGFGPQASIYFYGTGIETAFSGTRMYWLVAGAAQGARIPKTQPASGSNPPPADYLATVELQQHTTYFAALLTANDDNFFGAIVSPTPVEQVLNTPHFDAKSTLPAHLNVVLQGAIVAYPHDVQVALNGTTVGNITFTGQAKGQLNVTLPAGLLQDWTNTVTLTAQNGEYDTSLVQSIRITYPHLYVADSDVLKFSGRAGDELNIAGFTSAPTVLDITDANHPVQVTGQITANSGNYVIALQVPWTTTNPSSPVRHTLMAVAADRIANAAGVTPNHPSHWHSAQSGADIAMVTYEDFAGSLVPLVQAHQAEGKTSVVVPINDLYDEFNFGERSPFAIRQFLQGATQNWKKAPSYLLLNGRASFDPRDYLGLGHLDLVPTRILPTTSLMTASDDWFSDFTDSGMPTLATGRLPVSSQDEATTVVGKIVTYEGQSTNGAWTSQALFVADKNDTENFAQDSQTVQLQLPTTIQVTDVFNGTIATAAAQQEIINGINSGQLLVNYLGHGSEEEWSGSDIFDVTAVPSLTNSSQLPVFLIMDCLNGFFQDVYAQPLGVTLLLAPNGGAVAVLASTGLNQPAPQTKLDALVVQNALNPAKSTLGESILKAKSKIADPAVRRTFVLFGDPAMLVKQPVANAATSH